jgi:Zn-dependent alcohol dehydrogenase
VPITASSASHGGSIPELSDGTTHSSFFSDEALDCQLNFCRDPSTTQGWSKTVILGTDGNVKPLSISSSDIKRGRSIHSALLGGIKPKDDIPDLCWQTSIWTR